MSKHNYSIPVYYLWAVEMICEILYRSPQNIFRVNNLLKIYHYTGKERQLIDKNQINVLTSCKLFSSFLPLRPEEYDIGIIPLSFNVSLQINRYEQLLGQCKLDFLKLRYT